MTKDVTARSCSCGLCGDVEAAERLIEEHGFTVVYDQVGGVSFTVGLSDSGWPELVVRWGDAAEQGRLLSLAASSVRRNYQQLTAGLVVPVHDGVGGSWFVRMRPAVTRSFRLMFRMRRSAAVMELVRWEDGDPANVDRMTALLDIRKTGVAVVSSSSGWAYTVGLSEHGLLEMVRRQLKGAPGQAVRLLTACALQAVEHEAVPMCGLPYHWNDTDPPVMPSVLRGVEMVPLAADLYGDHIGAMVLRSPRRSPRG